MPQTFQIAHTELSSSELGILGNHFFINFVNLKNFFSKAAAIGEKGWPKLSKTLVDCAVYRIRLEDIFIKVGTFLSRLAYCSFIGGQWEESKA